MASLACGIAVRRLVLAGLVAACLTGAEALADEGAAEPAVEAKDSLLAPGQVVGVQMEALATWTRADAAAERVFSFASPANQLVTGPIEKFRRLVESAPYEPLIHNQGWIVGGAVEKQGRATVLVTVIDESGQLLAYRFYLSRQTSQPDQRWMTDAVYRFTPEYSGAGGDVFPTI